MESTFSLELSFAEIRWLAGAFAMANLPISIPVVAQAALVDAQKTLQGRGLIQPGELTGWQVAPLAAIPMQWMLNVRQFWIFNQFQRAGPTCEIALFFVEEAALLVLPLADGKRFVVCQNLDAAITEWRLAVNLPLSDETANLSEWNVPQPLTIIRSNWKHPQLAETMATSDFLTWASSLEWAGEWALITDEKRLSCFVLAVRGNSIWAGQYRPGRPGEFPIKSFDRKDLIEVLTTTG